MKIKSYLLIACILVSSFSFAQVGTGAATTYTFSIQAPGTTTATVTRNYRLYVPASYNASTASPLVFLFHGTGSNALQMEQMTGFDLIADTANFIIVYPNGLDQANSGNETAWNCLGTVASNQGTDLKFTSIMLDTISAHYNINSCKVYAAGFSIGGFMANDIGCFLNSNFAAIASVSGSMLPTHLSACNPSHPTPYMRMHGTSDGTVDYNGGGTNSYDSVATVVRYWVTYDNCTTTPTETNLPNTDTNDSSTVQDYLYPNGKYGSEVDLHKIIGGAHYWPTLNSTTPEQNGDFSASIAIWNFFRPYCLGNLTGGSCAPPSITAQPSNQTVCSGASTTFAVTVSGSGLTYQWQVNQGSGFSNLSNTSPYGGVTTATLTVTGATTGLNGYQYQCVVTGSGTCATSANSNAATLTVNSAPTITGTTPGSICGTGTATLGATASAGTINWYVASTGGSSLATGTSYTTPSISTTTPYYVDATNNGCTTAARTSVTATVTTTPSTPTVSSNSPVCENSTINLNSSTLSNATYSWTGPNSYTSASQNPTISSATTVMAGTYSVTVTLNNCTSAAGTTSVTVTPSITASVSISANNNPTCAGQSVTLTAVPTNGGTTPAYQWTLNGANTGSNSSTYSSSSFANGDMIACVLTSNANCVSPATASSNTVTMTVTGTVSPSVAISGSTTICAGASTTFTATPTNGGASPSYQWTLNGTNAGTNNSTYTPASLTNGQTIACTMTSNSGCANPTTAASNTITMTVTSTITASITISGSNSVCAGTAATFTATPTNGGAAPTYQWTVNAANVGSNSNTYSSTTSANGDVIVCNITSNAACASPVTASSNSMTMAVTPTVTPSVSISVTSGSNPTCTGQSVTFTAVPTNGGTAPAYQWTLNGSNVGSNSTTYSSSTSANGDMIACVLTSNASCATTTTASSNTVTMTVTGTVSPAVAISGSTTICAGASTTFTATPTNGGASPSYQWTLNGANVGTNSATYTPASLTNGQTIACTMTSSSACDNPSSATSNTITMTVTSTIAASVAVSGSNSVCAGAATTFTATPTNGGTAPSYQWTVNGANVGSNNNTYSSTTLANGDIVASNMTSNATCASPVTALSNSITMAVTLTVAPAVSISVTSGNNPTCAGQSVTFTAVPTNGGTTPAYQWTVNGTNTGSNSTSYSSTTFNNGDVVACVLTSNANCVSPSTAASNSITVSVLSSTLSPSVTITSNLNSICTGTTVTFTATPTNAGTTQSYQWMVNGGNVGTNSSTYSSVSLTNGQVVSCNLTASSSCAGATMATSNSITMSILSAITPSVSISVTSGSNPTCTGQLVTLTASPTNGGTTPAYQWTLNGANVGSNSTTYSSSTSANGDVIACVLTSNANCATTTTASSNTVTMTVTGTVSPAVAISGSTTICAGASTTFTATPTNGGASPSYQWTLNGANVGTNSATYTPASLTNGQTIACTMTSSSACDNPSSATSNTITMTVTSTIAASVAVSGSNSVCAGTATTFTATPTNGGTAPSYQWTVNGANVGSNNNTYSSTTLANGDIVASNMTSNATCASPVTALSNSITMAVTLTVAPVVSISVTSGNNPTCAGQSVTFTAVPTNGGTTPAYQWTVNGTNTGSNSTSYSSTTFNNGDVVACVLTSNANCVSPSTAASNSITVSVLSSTLSPSVTITSNLNSICTGTAVTFTATPTNAGTTQSYQWMVNGGNVGTNSSTYSSVSLTNGQVVSCNLTASSSCAGATMAASNSITMSITPTVTPAVSVTIISGSNPTSAGQSITFSATPTNGGTSPVYQWELNNANVGTNSSTYTSSSFTSGDAVTCVLISNAACANTATVTSANAITINVAATVSQATTVHVINTAEAKVKSSVISDGGSPVTAEGTVWSTSPSPTTALSTITTGTGGTGPFTDTITGLTAGTTYYVRSYATNANGTVYGNQVTYTAPPVMTCSPDSSITLATPGIFPKSLPPINDSNLTVDQTFTYSIPFTYTNSAGDVVDVDSSFLTGLLNLPPGLSYKCGRPNCIFYPGEIGCFVVSGTLASAINQSYATEFKVTDYGIINTPQYGPQELQTYSPTIIADTVVFTVSNSKTTGIETYTANSFDIVQYSPNPFNSNVTIKFTTPETGNVDFYVADIYGRELYKSVITASPGINTINYSADNLSAGSYYFTISNGSMSITKLMIAVK